MVRHISIVVVIYVLAALAHADEPRADLVLRGGKVITAEVKPTSATALAIRGSRIVAVGSDADIAKLIGDGTRVIELAGRPVMPGFIECHGHFADLGEAKMVLELTKAKSWDDVVAMVAKACETAPEGKWIIGRGWHQEHWTKRPEPHVEGYPVHEALSRVSPKNPVLLRHGTGHMCFANARAMELAKIDKNTSDPAGGRILRKADGSPTGALREAAMDAVERAHARSLRGRSAREATDELQKQIDLATQECLANGVTTFHDAGSSYVTVDALRELADTGKLGVRLYVMLSESNDALAARASAYRTIGRGDGFLTVRAIKRMIDGALGTHGAWLLAPYDDQPRSVGHNTLSVESLRETARLALKHDLQLCTHAIGDRANRETLDVYEQAFHSLPDGGKKRRWRIEHAQHIDPEDIPRFGKLGVIASMQACHATSDGPFVVARLGLRRAAQGAYAWRSLIRSGAMVINGTDAPVESLSPIACFYSSVTRRMAGGEAFFPEQRMTRDEALASYTRDAAYAGFAEKDLGTIAVGKWADVIVLSDDLLTVPDERLLGTRVDMTIVHGKVRYTREKSQP